MFSKLINWLKRCLRSWSHSENGHAQHRQEETERQVQAVTQKSQELRASSRELREELEAVRQRADDRGTDRLAELVRSMQRGRRVEREG